MSLLGIDIGTTGCKSIVFSIDGQILASSYREYDIVSEKSGFAELVSGDVWDKVKETIKEISHRELNDPIRSLSVSSLGEAFVPVTKDREILYNSILGIDTRGGEFITSLLNEVSQEEVYQRNGNFPGVFYTMPKIAWLKANRPEVYRKADYFLLWADFICFMLGGKPVTTYSLANRTLLFDIHSNSWIQEFFDILDLESSKFATPIQSGVHIGNISGEMSKELNLPVDVSIISGGHDQCCATLGSGITGCGAAMYGMGTYICMVPVFEGMPDLNAMRSNKLHVEPYLIPGKYVTFLYNLSGGALIKWFRNTFASGGIGEHFTGANGSIYDAIFKEVPEKISDIIVVPRFGATGPPDFFTRPAGCISNLSFEHTRGDILRAMLEGITFYFKEHLPGLTKHTSPDYFVANGGGAVSTTWLQITADILNKPIIRNKVTEASALGAAILAGVGCELFSSIEKGTNLMVHEDLIIQPNKENVCVYEKKFIAYKKVYSFFRN